MIYNSKYMGLFYTVCYVCANSLSSDLLVDAGAHCPDDGNIKKKWNETYEIDML